MKSNLITKSETNALLKIISEQWGIEFPKMKNLKVHQISDDAQIITGGGFKILKVGQNYLPFLSETEILKGANAMRPGIKKYTEFEKNQIVCIVEESQQKFLAVGKAMMSSSELENTSKGEVIKNLHYISDNFWETGKTIYD